ncbi:MAG: Hpt domain-containing protein [Clostridia bacterium]|nr:Hpt domain-containing protein [Clostridia bacterium]
MTVQECYEAIGGNYADALSRLRTDERITRFLIKVADDESFSLLCRSIEARNMEEAFRAAHTLKGICLNLSITRLQDSASRLTEALRGKAEYDPAVEPLLDEVKSDYELTAKNINTLR